MFGNLERWLLVVVSLHLIPVFGFSQSDNSLQGRIVSAENGEPMLGATIQLTNKVDSADNHFSIADIDGNFMFTDLEESTYILHVRSVGFAAYNDEIPVNGDTKIADIRLLVSTTRLDEVVIETQTVGMLVKGDTLQYLSNSYKTNPDATTEDLLSKLPGVKVNEGQVEAQGEQVQKILVDGREFFSNDPTIAIKTIPAEVIQKIEVFDQLSEQSQFTGFDDGNTTKTINIITKPEARNGQFGRAYSGLGPDTKYNIGGNINFFNDDQRISIIGLTNNINVQNFSSEDLIGVSSGNTGGRQGRRRGRGGGAGGGSGRGRGIGSSSNANDFLTGKQNGITETHSFGINYSDDLGENLNLTSSYFFNGSENITDQTINQQYVISDSEDQFYDEVNYSESENYNHRFNIRGDYRISERTSLLFTPRISIQENTTNSLIDGRFLTESGNFLSTTNNDNETDGTGLNFSNNLLLRHRLGKQGRTLSLGIRTNISDAESTSQVAALNVYATAPNDSVNQRTIADIHNETWSGSLRFTERLGQTLMLQLGYNVGITNNESNRETYQMDDDLNFSMLDTTLSNVFESRYLTNSFNTGLMWRNRSFIARIGVGYELAELEGNSLFPNESEIERSFQNILPMAMLNYKFNQNKNIRIFYRTNTSEPSVTDLQEVVNNSNPLSLFVGNKNLQQSYSHTFVSRYSSTNVDRGTSFFAFLSLSTTNNYVSNSTFLAREDSLIQDNVLLAAGSQLSQPVNLDGQYNVRSFFTYGLPVKLLSSSLNLNTTLSHGKTPGLINSANTSTFNSSLGQGVVLASNISEQVDFTLSYDGSYNIVKNDLQPELDNNYYFQQSKAKVNLILGNNFVFRTEINHQLYSGLSEDYNEDFFLWNASLGKKIFSNKRGEINISVFDILGENTSISRNVTETYIEDMQTVALSTYFMFNFTYNFKNYL